MEVGPERGKQLRPAFEVEDASELLIGETPLVQREGAQGQAPHASGTKDSFISQFPQAHHLSDRGSQSETSRSLLSIVSQAPIEAFFTKTLQISEAVD